MVYLSCERDTNMGGSINPEYPIAGWFIREILLKLIIWEYHFRKPPYQSLHKLCLKMVCSSICSTGFPDVFNGLLSQKWVCLKIVYP